MRSVKSIEQIVSESEKYSLVVTSSQALADSINLRCEPRIGLLAYTPEKIVESMATTVLEGDAITSTLTACKAIEALLKSDGSPFETDFQFIYGEVRRIERIMEYTDDIEPYLYSDSSKKVYEKYSKMNTLSNLMGKCNFNDFFSNKNFAVIQPESFSHLQSKIIPESFQKIDVFHDDGQFTPDDLGTIFLLDDDSNIAMNAVDQINKENADDTAIVVDYESPLFNKIQLELYRKDIPFRKSDMRAPEPALRNYLEFIRSSILCDSLKIADVRKLLSYYGYYIDSKYNGCSIQQCIDELDSSDDSTKDIKNILIFMTKIRRYDFKEVLKKLHVDPDTRRSIKNLLDYAFDDNPNCSMEGLNLLSFMVNNIPEVQNLFKLPVDERSGVLISNKDATFIDRTNVIFLGMGIEWTRNISEEHYIANKNEEIRRNRDAFSILIQQGGNRLYLAHRIRNGRDEIPCPYFMDLIPDEKKKDCVLDSFTKITECRDGDEVPHEGRTQSPSCKRIDHKIQLKLFSKTSFQEYCECPYKFMFRDWAKPPETDEQKLGIIIHQFAEFYIHNPGYVEEKGVDHFIEHMLERFLRESNSKQNNVTRTKIAGMVNNTIRIVRDKIGPEDFTYISTTRDGTSDNPLFEEEGQEKKNYIKRGSETDAEPEIVLETEKRVISENHKIEGRFDILVENRDIWDVKTGRKLNAKHLVNEMIKYNDWQPIIYLALLCEMKLKKLGLDDFESNGFKLDDLDENQRNTLFDISFNLMYVAPQVRDLDDDGVENKIIRFKLVSNIYEYLKTNGTAVIEAVSRNKKVDYDDCIRALNVLEKIPSKVYTKYSDDLAEVAKQDGMKKDFKKCFDGFRKFIPYEKSENEPHLSPYWKIWGKSGLWCIGNTVLVPFEFLTEFIKIIDGSYNELNEAIQRNELHNMVSIDFCEKCSYHDICFHTFAGDEQ